MTDAGFRAPWFRAVSHLGWEWVGRLRHRTLVKPVEIEDTPDQWVPCRVLYALANIVPRDLGLMETVRSAPWVCRMIVYGKAACGRKHRTRKGEVARGTSSRKHAHREREPWLLVASPQLQLTAQQLVTLYGRRMQIEESFRDLKSHCYDYAFEDSLTRKGARLEILLLLNALATFASWLVGLACEACGLDPWLAPR